MIRSSRDTATERLWSRQRAKGFDPRIERVALRKLVMLDAAENLDDLRIPAGNRREPLKGNRAGQHSIRIHQQWRVCFVWTAAGPEDVELVDYQDESVTGEHNRRPNPPWRGAARGVS
ncbi:MAG: type II toxin-antitoxin system RelE/ParE family toxin [Ornithinimicrobium sp.]|uniref:type II toxin-antitoxin system RelE/ParE family toxin n=1 Tax=Ornithinimicrobium sp. TaxID=1977084 RepID=UPI003D9B872F